MSSVASWIAPPPPYLLAPLQELCRCIRSKDIVAWRSILAMLPDETVARMLEVFNLGG